MRTVPFAGMSVTMPHKTAVAALVDSCTPIATALDAVNCVWWRGEELVGDNTDGAGFVDALRQDEGYDPAGRGGGGPRWRRARPGRWCGRWPTPAPARWWW